VGLGAEWVEPRCAHRLGSVDNLDPIGGNLHLPLRSQASRNRFLVLVLAEHWGAVRRFRLSAFARL
jgi:hypothetical protein